MLTGFKIVFALIALSNFLNKKPFTALFIVLLIIGIEKFFGGKKHPDKKASTSKVERNYDYYIEPCQLCISRNGSTYDKCGWCNDTDTHYMISEGKYPGDYIKIPSGGLGYPFHNSAHSTRKYYRNSAYIDGSLGKKPNDV